MLIIGIDTSTGFCSTAVIDHHGSTLALIEREMQRGQSEALIPMVKEAVAHAGGDFSALSVIGVTIGPGAFTGMRIGLAAARGLALALSVPAIGMSSLKALAAHRALSPTSHDQCLAAIDARRNAGFFQLFDASAEPLTEPFESDAAGALEALPDVQTAIVGDFIDLAAIRNLPKLSLIEQVRAPDPVAVARHALRVHRQGEAARHPPTPAYIRPADAVPNRPGRRIAG